VPLDIAEILNWQRAGCMSRVTRYFDNGWHASAGFVYNENSVPNTYYTPLRRIWTGIFSA